MSRSFVIKLLRRQEWSPQVVQRPPRPSALTALRAQAEKKRSDPTPR